MTCILGLVALLLSQPAGASGFVGNGGDGVFLDGKLFLRDLFSLGAHENPYFGARGADPGLPPLPTSPQIPFSYPNGLLAAKITDMNAAAPGLGDFVLLSLKSHNWVMVDSPLVPITDLDDPVRLPEHARLVQIANRLGSTIRINRQAWALLDDANKVALLIHEAVYSLVRPVWYRRSAYRQPARTAREITGNFFSAGYYSLSPAANYEALTGRLEIPAEMISPAILRAPPRWHFEFGLAETEWSWWGDWKWNKIPPFSFAPGATSQSAKAYVALACGRARKKAERLGAYSFVVRGFFRGRGVLARTESYFASEDPEDQQSYLRIVEAPAEDIIDYSKNGDYRMSCEATFEPQAALAADQLR